MVRGIHSSLRLCNNLTLFSSMVLSIPNPLYLLIKKLNLVQVPFRGSLSMALKAKYSLMHRALLFFRVLAPPQSCFCNSVHNYFDVLHESSDSKISFGIAMIRKPFVLYRQIMSFSFQISPIEFRLMFELFWNFWVVAVVGTLGTTIVRK